MKGRATSLLLALTLGACEQCRGGEHIAELVTVRGRAQRDHAANVDRWEAAATGAFFSIGDAVRTRERSRAEFSLGRSDARLRLGEQTTIRFLRHPRNGIAIDVVTGSAEIETGEAALELMTRFGEARIEAGSRVRLAAGDEGLDLSVQFGEALVEGELVREGQSVRMGQTRTAAHVEEDRAVSPADAGALVREPDDMTAVVQRREGRGASLRAPDATAWQPIEDAEITVAAGTHIRVPERASVALVRGDVETLLEGRGEYVVAAEGTTLVRALSGALSVTAGREVAIEVPGGTIVVRGAAGERAETRLDVRARGTQVGVGRGEAELRGTADTDTLASGEGAVLTPAGEIESVTGRGPTHADFAIAAGATITVHDPRPPTALGVRFGDRCRGRGIVELLRGSTVLDSSAGQGQANVLLQAGAHSYRLRCVSGGEPVTGGVRVVRDSGVAPLPPSAPRTMVDADGRTYRVMYQTHPPDITVRWPRAPGSGPYSLTVRGGSEARSFTSASPRFEIPSGALATGTYRLELRAGGQSASDTTLEIRFDNAMPTASIRSPADRGFGVGENVHVAGIAVPGWTASIGEVALAMDRQLRFEGTVTAPTHALAIELRHPSRGRHFYLRRPRAAEAP